MLVDAYQRKAQEVLHELRVSSEVGLSLSAVRRRREEFGSNALPKGRGRHPLWIFLDRFRDVLVLVLLGAAAVSLLLGRVADTIIIFAALLLDAVLSFAQVWRTERTLRKIHEHVQPHAFVIRNGTLTKIAAQDLVVGDIIEIRAGERVPADARLWQVRGLRIRESALTGESDDVEKVTAVQRTRAPLSNRRNMVYLGTSVVNGSGRAVVVATGARTEFGKIAQMLKTETSPPSPLRKKLQRAGLQIGAGILVAVAVLFGIGILRGDDLLETALTAITLVVSAIPEDLTMILTIALTVGVARILKHKGAVKTLASGETLGAATVICTDKTGTLTYGVMQATSLNFLQGVVVESDGEQEMVELGYLQKLALTGFALASDAHKLKSKSETVSYVGTATERAALAFAEGLGLNQDDLRAQWPLLAGISFNSQWKYRATLHDHPTQGSRYIFAVGAPEVLLERSSESLNVDNVAEALDSNRRVEITEQLEEMAKNGYRLVAVAVRRDVAHKEIHHGDVDGLIFLGVLLLRDPVRKDVAKAVAETLAAGVDIKLVTGDHPVTAMTVAKEVGLSGGEVLTSSDLENVTDAELQDLVERTYVFARITPLDKQRIVRALQARGHVVAMTGDGINDAVALKAADIGVAMGTGQDIAKEAADLVLLDDNFATIVAAIREGRVLRDNVRKVIAFLLATNSAEIAIFFASLAMGFPLPLLPAQVLWVNLVTDGTSDIALSLEPAESDVMKRRPENPRAQLIGWYMVSHIVSVGILVTIASMGLYWYVWSYLGADLAYSRTMIFTFLSLVSLLSVWSFRSLSESILKRGIRGNKWVPVSLAVSATLQLLAVYWPPLQRLFGTVSLGVTDWYLLVGLALVSLVVMDMRKIVLRKIWQRREEKLGIRESSLLAST